MGAAPKILRVGITPAIKGKGGSALRPVGTGTGSLLFAAAQSA